MKVLAVIPARGGSKGVKNKNIRDLNGKPLIWYTIESAKNLISESFDLVVSTDSQAIASVASLYGVKVINRDSSLATDKCKMVPVIIDALRQMESLGNVYDAIIILQPTCPFRVHDDIVDTLEVLRSGYSTSVISFTPVGDCHPARMYRRNGNELQCLEVENESINRQDLPETLIRNGLIYAITKDKLLQTQKLQHIDTYPLIIPNTIRSVNIDEMLDFHIAEAILEKGLL